MKRLSRNKKKPESVPAPSDSSGQMKISSFFSSKPAKVTEAFKTPEVAAKPDLEMIDKTPESDQEAAVAAKRRKLFRLKQRSSKIGQFVASTTSLISGNLDKRATRVHSPPAMQKECFPDEAKKRPLSDTDEDQKENKLQKMTSMTPDFQPQSSQHISTPTTDNSFTKIRSFQQTEQSPTQNIVDDESDLDLSSIARESLSASYGRHVVSTVEKSNGCISLALKDLTDCSLRRQCFLKGSWVDTEVKAGDVVNILSIDEDNKSFTIDDLNGLIVVNPDLLVSGTAIVSTLFCMRKAVLSERFKGLEGSSRTMLVGTLVHELLQESLKKNLRSHDQVAAQLEECLKQASILKDLLNLDINQDEMRQEVQPFLPHIMFFIDKYVMGNSKAEAPTPAFAAQGQRGRQPQPCQIWPGTVEAIKDIEENIWSPRLGIKGKVDLTVQVKMQNKDRKGRTCKTLPLELKTGRPSGSAEHRGQVIMYSMIMSERRPDPEAGLLLYLRTSSMQEVKAGIHEMRGLVQMRNQLASSLRTMDDQGTGSLPGPINAKRACKDCAHLTTCAIYQKIDNAPTLASKEHAMSELAPQALGHLSSEDVAFFDKWSQMHSLESGEARKSSKLKSLWCMTSAQRELQGQAISGLFVIKATDTAFTFGKGPNSDLGACHSLFQPGDFVILSSQNELAVALGTVTVISPSAITLVLDKEVKTSSNSTYVIDKYEYASSGSGNWLNLAKLMSDTPTAKALRDIVTKKVPATFVAGLPKETALIGKHILRPLNRVQQKAVFKTLMAEKFVLLKGMPGSGKTTMIVALVRLLVKMGLRILLTAYTHSAIDNVLLKLLKAEEGKPCFLRLGKSSRVHEDLKPFTEDFLIDSQNLLTTDDLRKLYDSQPVVATTSLSASNHPALSKLFDFCIVDEAGQSLLLSSLGALLNARKFVLVGDPEQLPPVVKSLKAKSMGLDVSLFSHLQDPSNTIPLSLQYRMNEDIQSVANYMTYEGQLECGNEQVATREATLRGEWPLFVDIRARRTSVAFFDTTNVVSMVEAKDELGISNFGEADFAAKLAKLAKKMEVTGGNPATVGLIAPYRAQVAILRKLLAAGLVPASDISTVDQFQGRDKDVIIYSCTRTKSKNADAAAIDNSIMSDWRRLNVAVTRAKARLWMVGNIEALKTFEPFAKLIDYLEQNDLVFHLS